MDDVSFLVQETMRLSERRLMGEIEDGEETWEPVFLETVEPAPQAPGLFFHLEQTGGTFIIRTLPSHNLAVDQELITAHPEEYPTLRLIYEGGVQLKKLKWFELGSFSEAEIVHQRVGQRRFPRREEEVCNLSDPGFSWWLEKHAHGFSLYSKMGLLKEGLVRLGPLADGQLAPHRWNDLIQLLSQLPLKLDVRAENNRFIMSSESEKWLLDEFLRVFTRGQVSDDLQSVFRLLGKKGVNEGLLSTCWYFLQEVAAVRRFWLEIEDQLNY